MKVTTIRDSVMNKVNVVTGLVVQYIAIQMMEKNRCAIEEGYSNQTKTSVFHIPTFWTKPVSPIG